MNLKRSKTQQDIFCKNAISKTIEYLKNTFVQTLKRELEQELECDINLVLKDNGDVLFYYPQQHEDSYLLKEVKLEIGVLSAWTPSEIKDAKPFVYDFYPQLFETDFANILVLSPVRTFWDKILILHAEAHRQTDIPMRYSRHYYDIYQLCNSKFKELAFNDLGLLTQVREYKSKYYYSSWANYNTAKPGSLRLLPNEANLLLLEKDYKDMQSMLYGENPTFKEIIELLKKLENELNSL